MIDWILRAILFVAIAAPPISAQSMYQLSREQRSAFAKRIGGPGGAAAALQGTDRKTTSSERDAIADSLVAIVIASGKDEVDIHRMAAISLLGEAGAASPPKRYDGAGVRLNAIATGASDIGFRAAATSQLTTLPPSSGSLEFLARIASSPDATATVAVDALAGATSDQGRERLRQLFIQKAVKQEDAELQIYFWAMKFGWMKRP